MNCPQQQPGQSFSDHQAETAAWMGYATADDMNADHDALHAAMCKWLGVPSHSLLQAAGEPHDAHLAWIEENAVLHLQRFMRQIGACVP